MKTLENRFVDTNIFIHTLFEVEKDKHKLCLKLFQKAENNEVKLWTTEWVLAEVLWFLVKQKAAWKKIKVSILKILVTKGLEVQNSRRVLGALDRCQRGKDFIDALNLEAAAGEDIFSGHSYDKGLDRYPPFKRLEPTD